MSDEASDSESLLASFAQQEEALIDWVRLRAYTFPEWHKYATSYDTWVRLLFEASGRIKLEFSRRSLFDFFDGV